MKIPLKIFMLFLWKKKKKKKKKKNFKKKKKKKKKEIILTKYDLAKNWNLKNISLFKI